MAELGNRDLSGRIIEAAVAVHAALGPHFWKSVYENALAVELTARGIRLGRQKAVNILDGIIFNFVTTPLMVKRVGPGRSAF